MAKVLRRAPLYRGVLAGFWPAIDRHPDSIAWGRVVGVEGNDVTVAWNDGETTTFDLKGWTWIVDGLDA